MLEFIAQAPVIPTTENLIPYIIGTLLFALIGIVTWFTTTAAKKADQFSDAIYSQADCNLKQASAMLLLTLKVHHPEMDVKEQVAQMKKEVEEKAIENTNRRRR